MGQYGQSSECPASGLGASSVNDLYYNLMWSRFWNLNSLESSSSAAKRITAVSDEATDAVVSIDLSTRLGVGVAMVLAILCSLSLWMACSGNVRKICAGNVRAKQYAQVHVDSEDFAE